MYAFTEGHSANATAQAFAKKLIKPNPTPCISLNLSLCLLRISMMLLISTSLKVVSIAVVFFASTSRRLMVLRRLLIFSVRPFLLNNSAPANAFLPGLDNAASTSSFNIFPWKPEGVTVLGSTFLSAMIAEATGVALTSFGTEVTGAVVACCWLLVADLASLPLEDAVTAFASDFLPSGFAAASSILANRSPIFNVSPS